MKKILFFLGFFAINNLFGQSAGFNTTYIVLSINGGANVYYDLNAATGNPDFNNLPLGTFCQGSANGIVFKGAEHNIYKCGGCDLTSTRIYYRIYLTGTIPGSFVSNSIGYTSGFINGCGGQDQMWSNVGYNANLLTGLGAGNYTLEVYSDATVTCSGGTIYAGNSGANYKATFTVNGTSVGGTVAGSQAVCSGNSPANLTLSGHNGNVTKWQRSTSPDFTSGVTDIPNATTTLTGASIGALTVPTYFRAVVTSGVCAPANSEPAAITIESNVWTGAGGTSDWNDDANWSCGAVPTELEDAVIAAGDDQPELSGNITVSVASLNVGENATLIVRSGSNLIVEDAVAVHEDGSLVLENNANLIQINDIDNTGEITVHKNSAPIYRLDYAMWSSPVAGETLAGFSPETLSNRFYHYNPLSDAYASVPGSTPFAGGRGYLIRVDNTHPSFVDAETPGTPWSGYFTGVPNNGDVNVTVTPQDIPGGIDGFNAVGNPYPSPINIAAFYAANVDNLVEDSSLYFWRKKNDAGTSSYAQINQTGYTANNGNDFGDSSNGVFTGDSSQWVINPGQGFIVRAQAGTIVFTNAMRQAENNNQQFRTAQDETQPEGRLWLNISGADGAFSQALVAYTSHTTNEIDYGWDGRAMTDGAAAIYSVVGAKKLGIQARAAFTAADVVPLGYKVASAGNYTISIDHVTGLFTEGQDVYLRDNLLGLQYDIVANDYSFTTEAGIFQGRFDVVYAQALGNEGVASQSSSIIVYSEGSSISISSGSADIESVSVYDMRGRLLYNGSQINAPKTVITSLQPQNQVLIVKVATPKGTVSTKLVH